MRTIALLLTALPIFALPVLAQNDEFIVKAMRDEMQRSKTLRLPGLDAPYYIEYSIEDADMLSMTASLGALLAESHSPLRVQSVRMRVGDYKFDNANYVYSDAFGGAQYDTEQLPLETNYLGLRHILWLATDRAFKTAEEGIARKRSALNNVNLPDPQPDFTPAPPVKALLPASRVPVDEAARRKQAIELSKIFAGYPNIQTSSVEFQSVQSVDYMVNSDGSELRTPDKVAFFRILARGQASDGAPVHDVEVVKAWDVNGLPPETDLRRSAKRVADSVAALMSAPQGNGYNGPVLFEGEASAQLFGQVLGDSLKVQRKPVPEPGRPLPYLPSELETRLGSRVLPEWMDLVDDPTQTEFHGQKLIGDYQYDLEGIPSKPVTLVEKGILKDLLRTRTPVLKNLPQGSNGHGRFPGPHDATAPGIGNLFVRASQTVPAADMKKKLIEMAKARNKPYAILIRKLDWPSSATLEELRREFTGAMSSGGGSRPVSLPLLVYRVDLDGKEELIRGVRLRDFSARSFKDIVAASDQPFVFNYLDSLAPFAMMGGSSFITNASIIAPSVLFDDLELQQIMDETPHLPVVPPPTPTAN